MNISIDSNVLVGIGIAALAWMLLRFVIEPRQLKRLQSQAVENLPISSAQLAALSVLRQIAGSLAVAGAIVVATFLALERWIQSLPEDESGLGTLVKIRSAIESVLDVVLDTSMQAWIAALAALGLIWLFVSYSRVKNRWSGALNARKQAARARFDQLAGSELREKAAALDAEAVKNLETHIEQISKSNARNIATFRAAPVLSLGEDGDTKSSIDDLQAFALQLREPATEEEIEVQGMAREELEANRRETAEAIEAQLAEIVEGIPFEIQTLSGTKTVTLAFAMSHGDGQEIDDGERNQHLRQIAVAAEVNAHRAAADGVTRSEPEFFRQWVAAGLTGEKAVQVGGFLGRAARTAVMIVLLLGFVGIGARASGPVLQDDVRNLEIAFGSNLADQELAAELTEEVAEESAGDFSTAELASDEETEAQLAQAMRASIARSLQSGLMTPQALASTQPQNFQLATEGARQRILTASTRPAPRLARGARSANQFRAALPPTPDALREYNKVLDSAIERRISRMRANEPAWRRLRAAAVKPAKPDLVADQFMRAVFPGNRMPAPHAMRVWTERATLDVARNAVATGSIPTDYRISQGIDDMPHIFTARDKALIADYDARTPRNVATHLDNVRSGRVDPGSLHRAAPSARGGGGSYNNLFPAKTNSGGSTATRMASSRVYTRVRFNARVGGVVIGRMPESGGEEVSVIGFDWRIRNGYIYISLETENGGKVQIGRFHAALAHQALAYAADGRVVAVTLPSMDFTEENGGYTIEVPTRQVVVHPAFEDTEFACSAIEIDRFVDTAMYGDNASAAGLVADRAAVTLFGNLLRYSSANSSGLMLSPERFVGEIGGALTDLKPYVSACGADGTCFPVESYSAAGFDFEGAEEVLACVASRSDPEKECSTAIRKLRNDAYYSVDSGVRERPYTIDKSLSFLRLDAHDADRNWPMDFIVQAVPILGSQDTEVPEDLQPWTFPAWNDDLRDLVTSQVRFDKEARDVLHNVRQFTVLQRLFRLALSGQLGEDFPLEQLVAMQEATADYVKVKRNERWNGSFSERFMEFMKEEELGLVRTMAELTKDPVTSGQCREAAQKHVNMAINHPWPSEASLWPTVDEVYYACSSDPGARAFRARMDALDRLDLIEESIAIQQQLATNNQTECSRL